jgi:hypothetical protein
VRAESKCIRQMMAQEDGRGLRRPTASSATYSWAFRRSTTPRPFCSGWQTPQKKDVAPLSRTTLYARSKQVEDVVLQLPQLRHFPG